MITPLPKPKLKVGILRGLVLTLMIHVAAFGQQQTVSGKITSNDGLGLPGVNVIIEGTTTGTTTDTDGSYQIEVRNSESVLVFSFIGFVTQRIPAGNRSVIDVVMEQDLRTLEEVVVVGYSSQEKKDLTGAVATIAPRDFERVPATNPLEAFQGRVPGLQITNSSGLPGSGAQVRIRGIQSNSTSNAANSPIFVVDGVITDNINGIAPLDIEHVSVLKDASEAAIYGARAANGVIIVQTKRGRQASKPEISFNMFGGVQGKSNREIEVLNADDWLELWTEAHENGGVNPSWTDADLAKYEGVDTDWLGVIRQKGVIQNYNLAVSGSSEASNYYVSASYLDHKGVVVATDYEKYTLRFNSDHKIGKRFRFGNSLNINMSEENGNAGEYGLAAIKVPLTRVYEDDGSWGRIRNLALEHQHQNPLWRAQNVVDNRQFKDILGNLYLTLQIIEGLEFTARGNVEWKHRYDTDFSPAKDPITLWEGSTRNLVTKRATQNMHWITDFLLDYKKTIGTNHSVKALLGYSLEENTNEWLQGSGSGTPNNSIQYIFASDPDPTTRSTDNQITDWSFISMFGRVNYAFKDKYLFAATIRRDGTSRLAEGNRWGIFPSASFGWRISEEPFMSNISFVSDLKLRGSIGELGNVLPLGLYQTVPALDVRNYVLNQAASQGYSLSTATNPRIKWESTTKKNIGVDASFFNDQVYTTLDYFMENTHDLLFNENLPESTGLQGAPPINAGEVKNTGVEAIIGVRKTSGDWWYDVNVNLTHVKNEVVDIGDRDLRDQGTVEGFPLRSFFGYRSSGLIRSEADLDQPQLNGKQIGDIWLLDIDGYDANGNLTGAPDGVINNADRTLIGKKYPDLYYGVVGSVGFRKLSLQVQLQGVQGVDKNILGGGQGVFHYYTAWAMGSSSLVLDRYHPTKNPDGQFPRIAIGDSGNNRGRFSDFWLDDASFLRIKNVNLNYDFSDLVKGINVKRLNVYFSIDNLYTFTKFRGADVDTTEDDPNVVVAQPRTFTLGFNATL